MSGLECTLGKFAGGRKLGGVADTLKGYADFQSNLNCLVFRLVTNNPRHHHVPEPAGWRTSSLRVLVDKKRPAVSGAALGVLPAQSGRWPSTLLSTGKATPVSSSGLPE